MEEKRHYSVIDKYNRKLTIKYKDLIIAETTNAMILKEVGKGVYDPVFYIPKEGLRTKLEKDNAHESFCPIKGTATYWNITGGFTSEYFAWSYEDTLPRSKKINGMLAFNMNYISFISEPI